MTKANIGGMALESSSWVQQFKEAMNVNGGDIDNASFLDYILHFLTFGWKVYRDLHSAFCTLTAHWFLIDLRLLKYL